MRISPKHYAEALYELLHSTHEKEWGKIVKPFVRTLGKKGMVRSLPTILRLVDEIEHREKKVIKVEIKAAHEVNASQIDLIVKKVFPKLETHVHRTIDPSLVGGVTLDTADQRFDISIHGALLKLERKLAS